MERWSMVVWGLKICGCYVHGMAWKVEERVVHGDGLSDKALPNWSLGLLVGVEPSVAPGDEDQNDILNAHIPNNFSGDCPVRYCVLKNKDSILLRLWIQNRQGLLCCWAFVIHNAHQVPYGGRSWLHACRVGGDVCWHKIHSRWAADKAYCLMHRRGRGRSNSPPRNKGSQRSRSPSDASSLSDSQRHSETSHASKQGPAQKEEVSAAMEEERKRYSWTTLTFLQCLCPVLTGSKEMSMDILHCSNYHFAKAKVYNPCISSN